MTSYTVTLNDGTILTSPWLSGIQALCVAHGRNGRVSLDGRYVCTISGLGAVTWVAGDTL